MNAAKSTARAPRGCINPTEGQYTATRCLSRDPETMDQVFVHTQGTENVGVDDIDDFDESSGCRACRALARLIDVVTMIIVSLDGDSEQQCAKIRVRLSRLDGALKKRIDAHRDEQPEEALIEFDDETCGRYLCMLFKEQKQGRAHVLTCTDCLDVLGELRNNPWLLDVILKESKRHAS